MRKNVSAGKTLGAKASRRRFLKAAAVIAGGTAGALGFPNVMRLGAQSPIRITMQTSWENGTVGYTLFQEFCSDVSELTERKLIIDGFPAGAIVRTFEMFNAVKSGALDAFHSFDIYWPGKIPACTFLTSYPFAMDRPDQWETWYDALGGREIAREAYGAHNMMYLGPIQHDDSLIHSKVPISSFEDFRGKRIRVPGGIIADVFQAAGVATVLLPSAEVPPAFERGDIDASDYGGWAVNWSTGLGDITKYVIMGPPATPCLHQPVDLMSILINMNTWRKIPKHLQQLLEESVTHFSRVNYAGFQKADLEAIPRFLKAGVEIIRLKDRDVEKFRKFAPEMWVKWALKDKLAMKAFKSQWEFMKSEKVKYYSEKDLVDMKGRKLVI
jgi:TRAP-type mannitol/chloroaromatic compound transport system substrate-binding protein